MAASSRIRSSARLRSVMSCAVPIMRSGLPVSSKIARPRDCTVRTVPSGRTDAKFAIVGPTALQAVVESSFEECPVVGVEEIVECLVSGAKCLLIQPKNPVKLVRPCQGTGQDVPLPAAEICEELGLLRLSLARNEPLFGLLVLSDVITPADVARKISARILEWSSAVNNPTILAVVTPQPVLRFKDSTNVECILVASQHRIEIARWIPADQPSPTSCSSVRPVKSSHFLLK